MIQLLEQKKRQKILLVILAIVLVITGVVWFIGFNPSPVEEFAPPGQLPTGFSVTDEKLQGIKLELKILDSDLFKSLKSQGALPVTAGETGRTNPFEPY